MSTLSTSATTQIVSIKLPNHRAYRLEAIDLLRGLVIVIMQAENRISQRDHKWLLAGEILSAQDCVTQAALNALAGIEVVNLPVFELKLFQKFLFVGGL